MNQIHTKTSITSLWRASRSRAAAVGLALAATCLAAGADTGGLAVRLSMAQPVLVGNVDVNVDVEITNRTNKTIRVPASQLPSAQATRALFRIADSRGKPVGFQATAPEEGLSPTEEMVSIEPGTSLNYAVELTQNYDLSKNDRYTIQYQGAGAQSTDKSTTSQMVWLQGRTIQAVATPNVVVDGITFPNLTFQSCSASRQTVLINDLEIARTASEFRYVSYVDVYQLFRNYGLRDSEYERWFGVSTLAGTQASLNKLAGIKSTFQVALNTQLDFNGRHITISCGCTKRSLNGYVKLTEPYKIHLCPPYWGLNAPFRAGEQVRLMSRHTAVAATLEYATTRPAALSLAISDPTKATNNAHSYVYYIGLQ